MKFTLANAAISIAGGSCAYAALIWLWDVRPRPMALQSWRAFLAVGMLQALIQIGRLWK